MPEQEQAVGEGSMFHYLLHWTDQPSANIFSSGAFDAFFEKRISFDQYAHAVEVVRKNTGLPTANLVAFSLFAPGFNA